MSTRIQSIGNSQPAVIVVLLNFSNKSTWFDFVYSPHKSHKDGWERIYTIVFGASGRMMRGL